MQNQDIPTYQHVLKLSLGLGGILNILCSPAVAEPLQEQVAESTLEPSELGISELGASETRSRKIGTDSGAIAPQPQPEALPTQIDVAERRHLLSGSAFIPDPKLSKPGSKTVANDVVAGELGSSTPDVATAPALAADNLANEPLEQLGSSASQVSTTWVDESVSSAAGMTSRDPVVAQLKLDLKPEPWSITRLMASDVSSSVQTLSVSEIQLVALAWNDASVDSAYDWISDLASAD